LARPWPTPFHNHHSQGRPPERITSMPGPLRRLLTTKSADLVDPCGAVGTPHQDRFAFFATTGSKSRRFGGLTRAHRAHGPTSVLEILRAGHQDYVLNTAAFAYMRAHALAGPVIEQLSAEPIQSFPDQAAWLAHLDGLGISQLEVHPNPVEIATEGALFGSVCDHGLLDDTVIVSDDAGQFRIGTHALCWVHAERLSTS
jgi:hypothetical protein